MARPIPKIIGVTGGSASGKTSFSHRLHQLLGPERSCVLGQDHYYLDTENPETANFDHPSAIDFDLLYQHTELLDRGIAIRVPNYCFKTHRRLEKSTILAPREVIILDGTLILTHTGIRDRLDFCVFLDISEKVRFERRLKRDIQERARTESSVRDQFYSYVQPMHEIYVDPNKAFADLVIRDDESFEMALWRVAGLVFAQSERGSYEILQPTLATKTQARIVDRAPERFQELPQ